MDRGTDAVVTATSTQVSAHRGLDVVVGGVRRLLEQRARGHDLPALAVTALWHVAFDPRLLDRVQAACADSFDRRHGLAPDARNRNLTRAHRNRAEVHGAGAALADAAA